MTYSRNLKKGDFLQDETLKRSFVRSLEIIGEAAKNLPENFKENYPNIPWKMMAGMRDKLIHHYFGVDYEVVWDVVACEIPQLHLEIDKILRQLT